MLKHKNKEGFTEIKAIFIIKSARKIAIIRNSYNMIKDGYV